MGDELSFFCQRVILDIPHLFELPDPVLERGHDSDILLFLLLDKHIKIAPEDHRNLVWMVVVDQVHDRIDREPEL